MTNIVVLTGAGISADSGVDTFRDEGGAWSKVNLEDVATPEGFARNPEMCHDFYNARRRQMGAVAPNPAHHALSLLERESPVGSVLVVTQNVDDLHRRAGQRNLIHMHGRLDRSLCAFCGDERDDPEDLTVETVCGACEKAGGMRPAVVWFGEMPLEMDRIYDALQQADLFVSIGTSGNVYPAAGFVAEAKAAGAATLELNLEATSPLFDDARLGRAAEVVPRWVEETLAARHGPPSDA